MKGVKMMQLPFRKWFLLVAIASIGCEGSSMCYNNFVPIPNIKATMEGYDPILGNPEVIPDPGVRRQIFEPLSELSDGFLVQNSFIDQAREYLHCNADLSQKTIRNYNEYSKERSSSHLKSFNADASVSAGFGLFSFSASAGYRSELTKEERNMQKFFLETNGEIVEKNAMCITHTVSISLFEKPVFTDAFLTALRELYVAAKTPQSEQSRRAYVRFVRSYGTHFMSTTYLGSKMVFRKLYETRSVDSQKRRARSECVAKSAYASLGVNTPNVDVSGSFERATKDCESADDASSFFESNEITSQQVITIGSLPHGDLEKWSNTVQESPVPIFFELEKISSLFETNWFNSIPVDDNDIDAENLNGTVLHNFFEAMSTSFCTLLIGRKCDLETHGCGYNSLCGDSQTCVTDPSSETGYTCNDVRKPGPVLMMGGFVGDHTHLSSGDAIGTWILPDLPFGVGAGTLSRVGEMIFSCGGYRAAHRHERTSSCFVLDRSEDNARWRSVTSLPIAMAHHTAVTVQSNIWMVHHGMLYELNTRRNRFRTFALPVTSTDGHCAVSNNSHSFIIGVGPSKDEIWINSEASNPALWHRVGYMMRARQSFGCVWLGDQVFIAGGQVSRADVEVFDTVSHRISAAGRLVQGRREGHRMMVLDGKPAVAGGWDGSHYLDSIETYDEKTGLWVKSERKLKKAVRYFGLVQLNG